MRLTESVDKLLIMVNRTICNIQVLSHRHRGEKSIGRIACPVALSSIFTDWANLKWGIVAYEREWCYETDPSILQHKRAPSKLLFRFSPTDHRDCHFREESREKVTVLTCKRRTTSLLLVQSACSARNNGVKSMGRRPPRGIEARISRSSLDWGVLKIAQMANGSVI